MKELFTAIYSKYDNSTALKSALSGGFYYGRARQGCSYPYAVFSSYISTPEDTFSAEINEVPIQINIYSDESSPSECFDLLESCKELFSGAVLVVENHENVTLIKEMEQPPMRVNNVWMAVLELSCLLQHT